MSYLDNDILLYLAIIGFAIAFFFWNKRKNTKNKQERKERSFRKRYEERKRKKH